MAILGDNTMNLRTSIIEEVREQQQPVLEAAAKAEQINGRLDTVQGVTDDLSGSGLTGESWTALSSSVVVDAAYVTLQAALTAGAGGTVIVSRSQVVPAETNIPANTRVLIAPGVVLTRLQPSFGNWFVVNAGAIVEGGEFNGNKAAATVYNTNYVGLRVLAGGTVRDLYIHDNNGHGARLEQGATAERVQSHNNGNNPGPMGTADGIYTSDATGVVMRDCIANNNARIGFTVTANSTVPASATLTNLHAEGNGFNDYDFETYNIGDGSGMPSLVTVVADRLTGGSMDMLGANVTLSNFALTRYRTSSLDTTSHVALRDGTFAPPTGKTVGNLYCRTLDIRNVRFIVDGATDFIAALRPSERGRIDGLVVSGTSTQGLDMYTTAITWQSVRGLEMRAAVSGDRPLWVGNRRGQSGARFEISEGRWVGYSSQAPNATGTTWHHEYVVGDRIRNIAPTAGGPEGWVCVAAGRPGAWKAYGTIAA